MEISHLKEIEVQDRHQLIAVARSENFFYDETRAIIPFVKHISPIFCVFATQFYFDTTSQLRENRDFIFLHFVMLAANCIRERRSFSALAASGTLLRRILWHFLFLPGNFMDPVAINSTLRIFSVCFPAACR